VTLLPEGVYPIVEATLYLATAPESNSASVYFKAVNKVEAEGTVQVPQHLRDRNRDARDLGHGEGYEAQVKERLARWHAAQEKALGIEQTETLPECSEDEVLDIKRRTVQRAESG
jgi:replication-associated recombination protein RarA